MWKTMEIKRMLSQWNAPFFKTHKTHSSTFYIQNKPSLRQMGPMVKEFKVDKQLY